VRVSARAKSREDHAGDPLDGLVNMFDLGIVLAVAFLLAALSSVKLTTDVLAGNESARAPAGSVVKNQDQQANQIELKPGQEVVGQGKAVGTVYQLTDGSTILVKPKAGGGTTTTPVSPATGTTTPSTGTGATGAGTPDAGATTPGGLAP
jgi:hypothetical protein